jgi:cellular nucleic acid-binding protein
MTLPPLSKFLQTKKVIYVLSCQSNKFYVGKTTFNRLYDRYKEHTKTTSGSSWTLKYPPVDIHNIYDLKKETDEDTYTKEYMFKYGIDNVRGGSYTSVILPEYKLKILKEEFNTSKDLCFICGNSGHMSKSCYKKYAYYPGEKL